MEKHQKIVNARSLRRHSTDAERHLWRFLQNRRLGGCRFRRQVPLGRYIADFACMEAKLIVELYGGQHVENTAGDGIRTEYLERGGFRVLRFWNNDVDGNLAGVLETIDTVLRERPPPGGPSDRHPHPSGEG